MESLPVLVLDNPTSSLALPSQFLASLSSPEDYEHAFTTISESKNAHIWWEADLILSYYKKYLRPLDVYRAGQLINDNTVKYYLRTASGFPPEFRIQNISFNHHYQATFSDEWDSKTLQFKGDKRFTYAEQAADEGWSTRKLKYTMEKDKEKLAKKEEPKICLLCQTPTDISVADFTLYQKSGLGKHDPVKFVAHELCLDMLFQLKGVRLYE